MQAPHAQSSSYLFFSPLQIVLKPLLSLFFLLAALQAMSLFAAHSRPAAPLPEIYALAPTAPYYAHFPAAKPTPAVVAMLETVPVVFVPSRAALSLLLDLPFFHNAGQSLRALPCSLSRS